MSKIKKISGLIFVGVLSISIILGIATRKRESEITPTKSADQEKLYHVASPAAETIIEIKQPQYICVADLLEVDENTLVLANHENLEMRECITVGCGGIF